MDVSDFKSKGGVASPLLAIAGLLSLFFVPLISILLGQFLAFFLFSSGFILGVKGRKSQRSKIATTGAVVCAILLLFSIVIGVDSFQYFEHAKTTPLSGLVLPFGWESNEIAQMFHERYNNNTYGFPFASQICPYDKSMGCQTDEKPGFELSSTCLCRYNLFSVIMNSMSYAIIVFISAYISILFLEKNIVKKITGQSSY